MSLNPELPNDSPGDGLETDPSHGLVSPPSHVQPARPNRSTSLRPSTLSAPVSAPLPAPRAEAPAASGYSGGLFGVYFFLATMALSIAAAWFVGPRLVEEYYYAAALGQARGEHDHAVRQLESAPMTEVSLGSQMVAQRIRPSVVSVRAYKRKEFGFGSGVILSSDGYIMSNAHVVQGARKLKIELFDRRQFDAQLIGVDEESDLAVLKIDATNLIPADWGDSEAVEVGSIVWAIGSPYEFRQTVTSGILSGKDRRGDANHFKQTLLQTDAAVNPGNSGGPLVDVQGRVIGINTSIFGKTFQGISFAVPSATAKFVFSQLVTQQSVTRGYLGVVPDKIDVGTAAQMGLPDLEGAMVLEVQPGSPADRAGLQSGDVLRRWDGVPIRGLLQVFRFAEASPVGSIVQVDYWRRNAGGVLVEGAADVVIGELPVRGKTKASEFFRQ